MCSRESGPGPVCLQQPGGWSRIRFCSQLPRPLGAARCAGFCFCESLPVPSRGPARRAVTTSCCSVRSAELTLSEQSVYGEKSRTQVEPGPSGVMTNPQPRPSPRARSRWASRAHVSGVAQAPGERVGPGAGRPVRRATGQGGCAGPGRRPSCVRPPAGTCSSLLLCLDQFNQPVKTCSHPHQKP